MGILISDFPNEDFYEIMENDIFTHTVIDFEKLKNSRYFEDVWDSLLPIFLINHNKHKIVVLEGFDENTKDFSNMKITSPLMYDNEIYNRRYGELNFFKNLIGFTNEYKD